MTRAKGLELQTIDPTDPRTSTVLARFAAEGRAPIALYRALANAPEVLAGFNGLSDALRNRLLLAANLRELAILRTAQLAKSSYIWAHHKQMAICAGASNEQIDQLGRWMSSDVFDARECSLLTCTDEMHDLNVSDETFELMQRFFDANQIVELAMTVAHYQCAARLIQCFGLTIENCYRASMPDWPRAADTTTRGTDPIS
jgi:4-carboxymuconolactone decarboxylase